MLTGFFPLDQSLKLPSGVWSEGVAKDVCRLSARMPFAAVAEDLAALTGVSVSPKSVERLTHHYGTALADVQRAAAEAIWHGPSSAPVPPPDQRPARRAISVDGVMINVRQAGWSEVKVGSVSDFSAPPDPARATPDLSGPPEYHTTAHDISYCAHLGQAEEFEPLYWAEMEARQVRWAQTQVAVSDAGVWVRQLLRAALPDGEHIVDWYHACQRLWSVSNTVHVGGSPQAAEWGERVETALWQGKVSEVLAELQSLQAEGHTQPVIGEAFTYFTNQGQFMHYPDYRQKGYPIASGTVESACKNLVGARCKLPGMRWSSAGAQAVLTLRAGLLSQRWDTNWSQARNSALGLPLN